MRRIAALTVLVLVLAGCGDDDATTTAAAPTSAATTVTAPDPTAGDDPTTTIAAAATTTTTTPAPAEPFDALPLSSERGDFFSASGACVTCHQAMTDGTGADVSIDSAWRSTMMANAARDPYWQATVASEVAANPGLAGVIEDKCLTCHSPMAHTTAAFAGATAAALGAGMLSPDNDLHDLAIDGVSCTACHQIEPEGLGIEDSFSGGFVIDADLPTGERLTYGPYDTPPGLANQMQGASGFIPVRGPHLQESDLCGACHSLVTPSVDATGAVVGEFPEQMTYVEWLSSSFAGEQSCQDCHLPEAEGAVQLSITGGPPRSPMSQHHFVGGNTFVLSMFRTFGPEIGVTAASSHFDATLERVTEQLAERTATVTITSAARTNGQLEAVIEIANLAGHKFPTGFPSRRAWLHLTVRDATGGVVFESGAWNSDGSIDGNDNDASPAGAEPHYEVIEAPDQVQIYEALPMDTDARISTAVLRLAGYWKDNRLLPAGYDRTVLDGRTAVTGDAAPDADFVGGSDTIVYRIDPGGADGPFTVEVELLYQPVGYRWAENLSAADPLVERFQQFRSGVSMAPVVVARATAAAAG